MIKAKCPICGVSGSIELFLVDDAEGKIMHLLAVMPSDCGAIVFHYMRLFSVEKNKKTSKAKSLRLLQEITTIIAEGGTYRKKHIVAPSHIWARAMQETCESLAKKDEYRALPNHNYLLQVANSIMQGRKPQQDETPIISPRQASDLQHVRWFVQEKQQQKPVLKQIPNNEAKKWLKKSRVDLVENIGMDEETLLPVLIAHRAMELYNKELNNANRTL